jgi:isopentenyl phosphate kinase
MLNMELVFLKLGGSLITDKDTPRSPRRDVLARLAAEILYAHRQRPQMQLVIGHGSGSFGHEHHLLVLQFEATILPVPSRTRKAAG